MEIERNENKTTLSFDNHDKELARLSSYLYTWYRQKKSLGELENLDEEAAHNVMTRYNRWKARFPKDNYIYWDEQKDKVEGKYKTEVEKLLASETPIEKISQFVEQLRRLIQQHIMIESTVKVYGHGDGGLILRFLVADLLEPTTPEMEKELSYFFFMLKCLEEYGLPISIEMLTDERGTQISYILRLSSLMAISPIIMNVQEYECNREEMTDWDSNMFEMQYEEYLKNYNISFEEEIKHKYKS